MRRFIELNPPYAQDARYYVCGPGGMNADVRRALMGIDVPSSRIHSESFGAVAVDDSVEGVGARVRVELEGENRVVDVPRGTTILQALLSAGHHPPYSCQAGVCDTCRARLTKGTVHMRSRAALDDDEIAQGAILACQAIPTTDEITLRFGD